MIAHNAKCMDLLKCDANVSVQNIEKAAFSFLVLTVGRSFYLTNEH